MRSDETRERARSPSSWGMGGPACTRCHPGGFGHNAPCGRGTQRLLLAEMGQGRRTLGMFRAAPLQWQHKGILSWSRPGEDWITLVPGQHPGTFLKTGTQSRSTRRGRQRVLPLSSTAGETDLAAPAPCPFVEEHPSSPVTMMSETGRSPARIVGPTWTRGGGHSKRKVLNSGQEGGGARYTVPPGTPNTRTTRI